MWERHSPEQIASSLRQVEAGIPVAEIMAALWRFRHAGNPRVAPNCAKRTPNSSNSSPISASIEKCFRTLSQ